MKKKELYAAPETEVLELRLEGVIAISGTGTINGLTEDDGEGGAGLDW